MVDFKFYLNKQGIRGPRGEKGDTGYSPVITEAVNTLSEYRLRINNEFDSFVTDNLRGTDYFDETDPNGTYLRYNKDLKRAYTGSLDQATSNLIGGARIANDEDMSTFSENTIVTPALFADNLSKLIVSTNNYLSVSQDELTSKTKITFNDSTLNAIRTDLTKTQDDLRTSTRDLNNQINAESRDRASAIHDLREWVSSQEERFVDLVNNQNITGTKTFGYIKSKGITLLDNSGTQVGELRTDVNRISINPNDGTRINIGNQFATGSKTYISGDVEFSSGNIEIAKGTNRFKVLSQDTVEAGDNITVENTTNGIKISSTASAGAIIDDTNPATDKVYSSSKTSDLVGELGNEVNSIAGRLNTLEDEVKVATTENLGLVQPDGTTITIDSDGKISAVGGGSGDVTADGDNIFTGSNTFTKDILIKDDYYLYANTPGHIKKHLGDITIDDGNNHYIQIGNTTRVNPTGTTYLGGMQANLNNFIINPNIPVRYIVGGNDKGKLLSSELISAGTNVTLDKNSETGEVTINCTSGSGDVTAAGDNVFTGSNSFNGGLTVNTDSSSKRITLNDDTTAGHYTTIYNSSSGLNINSQDSINMYTNNNGAISLAGVGTFGTSTGVVLGSGLLGSSIKIYTTSPIKTFTSSFGGTSSIIPQLKDFTEGDNITLIKNETTGQITISSPEVTELKNKVEELQLYKFPNATIEGDPTINNGQVSDFSTTSYLKFPFEFKTEGRTWLLNGSFDTDSDVTTQQNIIDSLASVALAVRNGRLVLALSTNGTSFNLGEHESMSDIEPNTKYYYRLSFSGTQYLLSISTDKQEWLPEIIVASDQPIASKPMTISSSGHPFKGTLNLNDWDLTVASTLVWQGMDDVGIASRMDVNGSNITETGKQNIIDILGGIKLKEVTQQEYEDLEVKDPTVLYIIKES